MTYSLDTQQGRDAAALNDLATISVNKALDALKASKPADAAAALRSALGFADRLVTANAAVVTSNARQAHEFHGYDVNDPKGDLQPAPSLGGYDLNNL